MSKIILQNKLLNKNLKKIKKKKIIKKKFIFLNKLSLKKKNLTNLITELKNNKYIIVNNINNYNEKSKIIDLELKAKLINTSQCRLLNLPFSGITKLIKFDSLTNLKNKINLLILNKQNFKIIAIKFNKRLFLFQKFFRNLFIEKNFDSKKNFIKKKLIFFLKNYQNIFVNFFFYLLQKNLILLKNFYQKLITKN